MKKRLFFLKQDGWFEVEVTAKLVNSSNEELLRWAYAMMNQYSYRNYLITENPALSLVATRPECRVNENAAPFIK